MENFIVKDDYKLNATAEMDTVDQSMAKTA
jgi:hypothetical protein